MYRRNDQERAHTLPLLLVLNLSLPLDHFLLLGLRFTAFVGHLNLDSSVIMVCQF